MKKFFFYFSLSLASLSYCFASNNMENYWRCFMCGQVRKSEKIPEPKKCIATNFQRFHDWILVEWAYVK